MQSPFDIFTQELRSHFPEATVAPYVRPGQRPPRPDQLAGEHLTDYFPLLVTQPGGRSLVVNVETTGDYLKYFSREGSAIRNLLAHHGYWRIESSVNPKYTHFWILMLFLKDLPVQYLILPTERLKRVLDRTHNREKFSLFLTKSGRAFAAQPLSTAKRLAVLNDLTLLNTEEHQDLILDSFLNNWHQLAAG